MFGVLGFFKSGKRQTLPPQRQVRRSTPAGRRPAPRCSAEKRKPSPEAKQPSEPAPAAEKPAVKPADSAADRNGTWMERFWAKHRNLKYMAYASLVMVLGFLKLIHFRGWDIWVLLWGKWWIVLVAALSPAAFRLAVALVRLYTPKRIVPRRERTDSERSDGTLAGKKETLAESTGYVISGIIDWIVDNRLIRTTFMIALMVLVSGGLAHGVYTGVNVDLHIPGLKDILEPRTMSIERIDDAGVPEENGGVPPKGPDEKDDSDKGTETGTDDGAEPEPPSEPEPSYEAEFILLEPDRYFTLSEAEQARLFFQLEEPLPYQEEVFTIADWTDSAAIARTLEPYIAALCAQQRPNIFDQKAPESTKNEIVAASRKEAAMTNSGELDEVIGTRTEVWEKYSKYGIASLLANNMLKYAQEYDKINGYYETVKYYEAYSIFWSLESLTFESATPYQRKEKLNYIAMRYHDIADAAAYGSTEQKQATAISGAFDILANMDFSQTGAQPPGEPSVPSAVGTEALLY